MVGDSMKIKKNTYKKNMRVIKEKSESLYSIVFGPQWNTRNDI